MCDTVTIIAFEFLFLNPPITYAEASQLMTPQRSKAVIQTQLRARWDGLLNLRPDRL